MMTYITHIANNDRNKTTNKIQKHIHKSAEYPFNFKKKAKILLNQIINQHKNRNGISQHSAHVL